MTRVGNALTRDCLACVAAEFFPEHPTSYYAYPVDPDSAMCLEVFAGMDIGREMVPGTADCQPATTGSGTSGRRYSTPGSSPSYDYCGPRSPNALSDNGKVKRRGNLTRIALMDWQTKIKRGGGGETEREKLDQIK